MWMPVNSGPCVVPIQSSCPHDFGVNKLSFVHFRVPIYWESIWDCSTFDGHFGKMDEHERFCFIILMFQALFVAKKTTWDILLVVWNHVVRTLDKLQLKEARRWDFFSDKSLVVCTPSSYFACGPFFAGIAKCGDCSFACLGKQLVVKDCGWFFVHSLLVEFEHLNGRPV